MLSGPRVDIYVGPKKKHYQLPKLLLRYYSPILGKCFNGSFEEARTQTLELPKDDINHFELLFERIMSGSFSGNSKESVKTWNVEECISFIQYTLKYGLGDVGGYLICNRMQILYGKDCPLEPGVIELVFKAVPPGYELRSVIAQAAICQDGVCGHGIGKYREQEENVDGFAQEVLLQLRQHMFSWKWYSPVSARYLEFAQDPIVGWE